MSVPTLLLLGDFSSERISWDRAVDHVGWEVRTAPTLDALKAISEASEVPAIFLDCQIRGRSQKNYVKRIQTLVPRACIVLCCPIDSAQDIDLEETGAFDVIARPLKIEEVRRCIGFVWKSWTKQKRKARVAFVA